MIAREPIVELAESLRRVRMGEGTTSEVVQWLRASSDAVAEIPRPQTCGPHRNYTRTLLHKSESFEILALHWPANCISAIHDNGGAHCCLAVARGTMGVENFLRTDSGATQGYAAIALEGREELEPGAVDYRQDDVHLHRCLARDGETITLHVYAHPIERFNCFDERNGSCFEAASTHDAVLTA